MHILELKLHINQEIRLIKIKLFQFMLSTILKENLALPVS